jgi:thiosulfate/3-mercaptopyruvate sulfurtransferase
LTLQEIPSALAVSPEWLEQHRHDPEVVIVDCRFSLTDADWGAQQYQTGHLPGAFYADLNQDLSGPAQTHGGRHPLPDPQKLAAKLSRIGITDSSLVIAYDDSRLAYAARLWWLLQWLGHERVVVLDGGLSAYRAAGYSLTTEIPDERAGDFRPRIKNESLVDIAGVKADKDLPGVILVDSREGDRYRGEREPIDPIAGHIPGAVNYPWQEVTDTEGRLQSVQVLKARWAEISSAEEIIVYCGSGVTACVNLLSLQAAGITTGKLYPGSWSDWCSYLS